MNFEELSYELKSAPSWIGLKLSPSVHFSNSRINIKMKKEIKTVEWDDLDSLSLFFINPIKALGLYKMITSGKISSIHFMITIKTGESHKFKFTNVDGKQIQEIVKMITEKTSLEPQLKEGVEAMLDHTIEYLGKVPRRQGGLMANLASKTTKPVKLKWKF